MAGTWKGSPGEKREFEPGVFAQIEALIRQQGGLSVADTCALAAR